MARLDAYARASDGTPLPSWIAFNTQTFTGIPTLQNLGTVSISVVASDAYQGTAISTFNITVNHILPVVRLPTPKQTVNLGQPFSFSIPTYTFFDQFNPLTYSAIQNNQDPLPSWISFDNQTLIFSGIPVSEDENLLSIQVTAADPFQGNVSETFSIQVNHILPAVLNPIPDQNGFIGAPFNYPIPSNTFSDQVQQNTLTINTYSSNKQPLPSWLTFDSETNTILGTPPLSSLGKFPLEAIASDPFNGTATSPFYLLIQDARPVVNTPCQDQTVQTGNPCFFVIPSDTFSNPAGLTLHYNATKPNGDILPSWLKFDPNTLIFSGPSTTEADVGSIFIQVTATNSYSQSTFTTFQLTVSNPPTTPIWNLIWSNIKTYSPVGIPTVLFTVIMGMLLHRWHRIRSTQNNIQSTRDKIRSIDSNHSTLSPITSDELKERFSKLQKEANHISLDHADQFQKHLDQFLEQTTAFCLGSPKDSLFDLLSIHHSLNKLLTKTHGSMFGGSPKAIERSFILSKAIHQLCNLIILTKSESEEERPIDAKLKRTLLQNLENTISSIPKNDDNKNVRISDIRFHLESAQEAVRCMFDNTKVLHLIKESIFHILSPSSLASDVKAIFGNIPDQWYPALLRLQSMVAAAKKSLEALQELQQLINTQSDWHFYYASIEILSCIAKDGDTKEIRKQALSGNSDKNEPGLTKFLEWTPYRINRIKKEQNLWLQNKAEEEYKNILSHDLEMGETKEGAIEEKRASFSAGAFH